MSGGFFGFDTSLPEHRSQPSKPSGRQGQGGGGGGFGGFGDHGSSAFDMGGLGRGGAEEEDLAVYNWGDGGALLEGGDDFNDETFGDMGPVGNDFQFSSQPAPLPSTKGATGKPRGPIASTESRYKPKAAADPFAFSEDDFYGNRRGPAKPAAKPKPSAPAPMRAPKGPQEPSQAMWGAQPTSSVRPPPPPSAPGARGAAPAGQIKTLEEIEAEMARMNLPEPPKAPQVLSLEEIEAQMMSAPPADDFPRPPPQGQGNGNGAHTLLAREGPPREDTPVQMAALAGSGYASGQALLDSMFPTLSSAPVPGHTANFPVPMQLSPAEQLAQREALQKRLAAKIEGMSKYNYFMGNSDKDYITRSQLAQLATSDPYISDFYAQVFSALKARQQAPAPAPGGEEPSVVTVAPGFAFGLSGLAKSRFGEMNQKTRDKLNQQMARSLNIREQHQKQALQDKVDTLKGTLGKTTKGSVAAPRAVLNIPAPTRPEHRPANALNQQTGVKRQPLTRKQVMVALEELYDAVLGLEQKRREMPPPTATMEEGRAWEAECAAMVENIWRRLMVMEPLDISNPHPFISLLNPLKGQRLMPRLLRHLAQDKALTLLTLLIATYPQLDVVARAPPPPVADASLLTKADKLDRARREAETDNFMNFVLPGMDMLINRCNLGLVAGLLGICAQRMDVVKVAGTRPGVALFTALLSRAQSLIRTPHADPSDPAAPRAPDANEVDQWNKTFIYLLQVLLPHLNELFPSSAVQRAAFGPGAYLMGGDVAQQGIEMERREAEAWNFTAALAVNAPEEEQTNLVAALREKIIHTVQEARNPGTSPQRAEIKLRNVNMFLNGLGLDASMIE